MRNIIAKASLKIEASAARVWEALINPDLIKQYFFGTQVTSSWQVGSPITFVGEWEGNKYEDKGTVLEIIHNKVLRYSYWSSLSGLEDKPENYVPITAVLYEVEGETTVTVTQENLPDEKARVAAEENWRTVLAAMKQLLEKDTVLAS